MEKYAIINDLAKKIHAKVNSEDKSVEPELIHFDPSEYAVVNSVVLYYTEDDLKNNTVSVDFVYPDLNKHSQNP